MGIHMCRRCPFLVTADELSHVSHAYMPTFALFSFLFNTNAFVQVCYCFFYLDIHVYCTSTPLRGHVLRGRSHTCDADLYHLAFTLRSFISSRSIPEVESRTHSHLVPTSKHLHSYSRSHVTLAVTLTCAESQYTKRGATAISYLFNPASTSNQHIDQSAIYGTLHSHMSHTSRAKSRHALVALLLL